MFQNVRSKYALLSLATLIALTLTTPAAYAQSGATGYVAFVYSSCPPSRQTLGDFEITWGVNSYAAANYMILLYDQDEYPTLGYEPFNEGTASGLASGTWLSYGDYYVFYLISNLDGSYDYSSPSADWLSDVTLQC